MQPFDDVIGNLPAKKQLNRILETDEIPSSMLFEGPSGVGKARFARRFAQHAMGVQEKKDPIDCIEIFPEGKTQMHTMAALRDMIETLSITPHEGRYKFFIIHEAEKMQGIHASVLLKTLEEPPVHGRIILITCDKEQVLETILSRCIQTSFSPIDDSTLREYLLHQCSLSSQKVQKLLPLLGGSLEFLDFYLDEKASSLESMTNGMLKAFFSGKYSHCFMRIEAIEQFIGEASFQEKQRQVQFLLELIFYWHRDGYMVQNKVDQSLLFFQEEVETLSKITTLGSLRLDIAYQKMVDAKQALQRNMKLKHVIEHFLLSLPDMLQQSH